MTTIVDLRARVQAALGITGASAEPGYEDASLDQHITRAVGEFSTYLPVKSSTDLALAAGSRTRGIGGLARLLRVVAVETPVGRWPRALVDYDHWSTSLTLDLAPPGADTTVRVYYEQAHLVDTIASTVPIELEYMLVEGAAAFAVLARATAAANTWTLSSVQPQTYQHLRIAQSRLAAWRSGLRRLGGRTVRRRFYTPASGPVQRAVVGDAG